MEKKLDIFSLREQVKDAPSHYFISVLLEVLANAVSKTDMMCTDWEGRNKTLFTDDMIVYKHPKEPTKKLMESDWDYSRDPRHKVNTQTSTAFLYISHKWLKFEIKHTTLRVGNLSSGESTYLTSTSPAFIPSTTPSKNKTKQKQNKTTTKNNTIYISNC